jgi:hypothetical protein
LKKKQTSYFILVKCIINRPAYFAQKIMDSVKGAGTDDERLIRLLVTRSEVSFIRLTYFFLLNVLCFKIDLEQSKDEYQKLFKKSMVDSVGTDISGDYKKIIVKLIKGNR